VAIGEASLDVAPESALVVSGDDERGMLVLLDRGASDFEVAPRRARPPFIVEAGDVRVRVIGTRFRVERASSSARVSVSHGVVEVTSHGETFRVAAGETWAPRETPTARPAAPPRSAGSTLAPSPSIELEDDDRPPPVRTRAIRRRPAPIAPRAAEPTVTVPEPIAAPAPPAPRAPSTQERYEAAAKLEHRNPNGAMEIYRDLARGSDAWAKNALFAAGRLEAERGARADATRLLREYLRRFPGGPNAGDARALLDKLR
jgi:hypothetical protein